MILNQLKNKTKLYVHILPSPDYDWDCIQIEKEKKAIYLRHLYQYNSSLNIKTPKNFWKFRTNGVFSNCCQSEVYLTVGRELMDNIFSGIDNVIMSYGQNNSGKTFVMSGLHNQFQLRGIIPRFVSDLFWQTELKKGNLSTLIYISAVEIENNSIFDVLSKAIKFANKTKEITKVKLQSESHCLKLLFLAESRRKIIENSSYNSHSGSYVVTFTIRSCSLGSQQTYNRISKFHFIELAGVETVHRNKLTSFKDHMTQGNANVTKTLLEIFALRCQNCIDMHKNETDCSVNQRIHILTKYLDKSFSPTSVKTFLCHIRPHHEDLMITLSLLKFGMSFKKMCIEKPVIHVEEPNAENTIEYLKGQIKILQDKIIIDQLWEKNCPMTISQGRIDFVRRLVVSFLTGELSESELLSLVDDCRLILTMIKIISKEKSEMVDSASQTDYEKELRFSSTNDIISDIAIKNHERDSLVKHSSLIADKKSVLKRTSVQNDKNLGKAAKGRKNKDKVKDEVKAELKSEEVQVNLIEALSELPTVDSREHHWATFLISRPDIQNILDKSTLFIKEKEKSLNITKVNHDNILDTLNTAQTELRKLEAMQFVETIEIIEKEATPTQYEKINLLRDLKTLQRNLEISKQKLINDQIEWLDAVQNLNDTKQTIEKEFEQFCSFNNLFLLPRLNEIECDECKKGEVIDEPDFNYLEDVYNTLQRKYLCKFEKYCY